MNPIRIFIACNDLSYFKGIESELNENNIIITGMCRTSDEALNLFQPMQTDIVIMDLYWSEAYLPAVQLMQKLKFQKPTLKFIGVTPSYVKAAIQDLINWRFKGYVTSLPHDPERTRKAIYEVNEGRVYYKLF